LFDTVEGGPLEVKAMDAATPLGPLPCGFGAPVGPDNGRPWVGMNVDAFPRHLTATAELDVKDLNLAPGESIDVLDVGFFIPYSQGPVATATVSLSADQVTLTWVQAGQTLQANRARPGLSFTLVLGVDRGRGSGVVSLSFLDEEPPMKLGPINLKSLPYTGSPLATVRVGVLGTLPTELGGQRGPVQFRPVAIETGWGRR